MHSLWLVATLVFLVNLPFGFWRASSRRYSGPWFLAIHAPVALSVGLRLLVGIRFMFATLPLFVGAFVLGQSLGGRFWALSSRTPGPRRLPEQDR
jgi:hypothetical protein